MAIMRSKMEGGPGERVRSVERRGEEVFNEEFSDGEMTRLTSNMEKGLSLRVGKSGKKRRRRRREKGKESFFISLLSCLKKRSSQTFLRRRGGGRRRRRRRGRRGRRRRRRGGGEGGRLFRDFVGGGGRFVVRGRGGTGEGVGLGEAAVVADDVTDSTFVGLDGWGRGERRGKEKKGMNKNVLRKKLSKKFSWCL